MASTRAIEAGKAIIRVALDRADVDKGLKDMEARFRAAQSTISSMGTALLASGTAMGATLLWPLKYADNIQQVRVSYETMLHSATKAKIILKDIKDFAAKTPFGFMGLAESGGVLLNYNVSSEKLLGTMRMLGDVAGGNEDKFKRLTLAYGQAQAKGRLMGQEVLQMVEAGFNPLTEMSRTSGRSVAELSKAMEDGEISAAMLTGAFESATSEGGKFFGLMEKQSKTFLGKFSTLMDDTMDAILPVGAELMASIGPAMDVISQMVGSLAGTLTTTEGLATSWLAAAAGAVALGVAMIALSKAIAVVNMGMTVMRGTLAVLQTLWTLTKITMVAMTAAWVATQLAIHAVTASVVIATVAVRTFGATTVITTIATKAWQAITLTARGAMLLMTNAVTLGKVAIGSYLVITSAVSLTQTIFTGRLIASFVAMRAMAAGSGLLASAFGIQAIATAGLSAVQSVATVVTGFLTGGLGMTTAAAGVSGAAAGGLSAAWSIASGVINAAYVAITWPLTPLYIATVAVVAVIAVIAAAAAAAAVSAGVFSDAWNYVKQSLSGILAVVQQVAGGLKDALAAGQYMQAAQILWAGIQQLFWMGTRAIINAFRDLPGYIWSVLKKIAWQTLKTVYAIFNPIPALIAYALSGGDISGAIAKMMGTGDWLEGLAIDRIIEARNEMQGLNAEAKRLAGIKAESDSIMPGMPNLGGDLGVPTAVPLTLDEEKESDIAKRIKDLKNEARELKLGADAAEDVRLVEEARAKGQSDESIKAELAALDVMRKRKQYLEDEKDATEKASEAIVKKIDAQASDLAERGMSADEIYKRQIDALDKNVGAGVVNGEDAASAKEQAAIDRDERLKSRADEGKQLADSLKTPLEKFNDEVLRIQGLRASGSITGDTANRAIARERETLAEATNKGLNTKPAELGIATLGSKEAFDAIARSRSASVGSDLGPRVSPEMRAQLAAVNRQVMATEQLPARFAESVQAQVVAAINTKRLEDLASKQLSGQSRQTLVLQTIERNTRGDGGEPL